MSNDEKPSDKLDEHDSSTAQRVTGPFGRVFAPNGLVWGQAIKMASNKNVRTEDLSFCVGQDPVLVLELLKTANALYFSGGRPPITAASTAIVRLGSETVIETLQGLREREHIGDATACALFEIHRNRGKRCSIIARMLAEITAKTFQDDCSTGGLFMYIGEMLAISYFGPLYVRLQESNSPSGLLYKLAHEHKFDVEKMGLGYLQRQGIPDSILFAIDREGKTRSQDRAIMKPVCFASSEVVDAFDSNRWEKLAPGRQLNPKSTLRLLQLSDNQYLKFYEKASEYLFNEKISQERVTLNDVQTFKEHTQVEADPFIITGADPVPAEKKPTINNNSSKINAAPSVQSLQSPPPNIANGSSAASQKPLAEKYNLGDASQPKTKARTDRAVSVIAPPPLRTAAGNAFVSNVTKELDLATNGEELLRSILGILIEEGPFEKSALIVISKDRKNALVVAARGPSIVNGQTLILEDPLSPLAQCFSKVQSFGSRASSDSPWGSKAFALSPVDADHETPVALYADCGNEGSLTFEARRIFRVVVDILNQKLPSIPGGIPVEL